MKQTISQIVYNNTNDYVNIVDKFIKGLTIDQDIKRVNFLVFKKNGSFADNFVPFMEKDTYLNKKISEKNIKFNLLQADREICDRNSLKKLLGNDENLSIVVIDAYSNPIKKTDIKSIRFLNMIKNEIITLKDNLKTISKINSKTPVYILSVPIIENETSNNVKGLYNVINLVYKVITFKYSNVNIIKPTLINKKYNDMTNAYGFGQMAYLLNAINLSLSKIQTDTILDKVNNMEDIYFNNNVSPILTNQ